MKGKDGRKLSSFQSKDWMHRIAKKRKYRDQSKGEKHWMARLTPTNILVIRVADSDSRLSWCFYFGISERHFSAG